MLGFIRVGGDAPLAGLDGTASTEGEIDVGAADKEGNAVDDDADRVEADCDPDAAVKTARFGRDGAHSTKTSDTRPRSAAASNPDRRRRPSDMVKGLLKRNGAPACPKS